MAGASAGLERRSGELTPAAPAPAAPRESSEPQDPLIQRILALRSKDRDRVVNALREGRSPDAALVPHVIPLLAWDVVAPDAILALQNIADGTVGQLVDFMLDPRQDFAIRRRLARVLWASTSQRAVDGLLLALDDRFEVRFQCGRSLVAIADRNAQPSDRPGSHLRGHPPGGERGPAGVGEPPSSRRARGR